MALAASLLPEWDQEMAGLRKTLERIPDDKLDWKPHEKSMTFGGLATHLANLPHWAKVTMETDDLDYAPVGEEPQREEAVESVQHALELFDARLAEARAAIAAARDERLLGPWTLLAGGETLFTMPRIAVLKSMIVNHMIHHRAQLGVYLRLNDLPVPALYGPSADEG